MRRALVIVALAASWALLLIWAANVDVRSPLLPETTRLLPGSQFDAVFGAAHHDGDRLHVDHPAADFSALQSTSLRGVDAAAFHVLRYRFADFPRTLELSLVFRSADRPDDVRSVSLPWPGAGVATFDLSRDPAWHGTIIELGFAEYATPQLVPADRGFAPFDLVTAELWSPSWRGAVAALRTDWFGVWPWSQRSVHVLGRDNGTPNAHSLVLAVAVAAALAAFWAIVAFGWRRQRAWRGVACCVAIAWIALDVVWQDGLWYRLLATRAVYADVDDWTARERIVGDLEIRTAADRLKTLFARSPPPSRILVNAPSKYSVLRLIWHLLPLNASDLGSAFAERAAWPDGILIVFYESDAWRTDVALRQALLGSERVSLTAGGLYGNGFDVEPLVVFRYHRAR